MDAASETSTLYIEEKENKRKKKAWIRRGLLSRVFSLSLHIVGV